jgi:hypothetical protein
VAWVRFLTRVRVAAAPGVRPFGGCPPKLNPAPSLAFAGTPAGIRATRFVVNHVSSGARVEARRQRRGLRQVVRARPGSDTTRMAQFVGKVVPVGSSLEIWVTRAVRVRPRARIPSAAGGGDHAVVPLTHQSREERA